MKFGLRRRSRSTSVCIITVTAMLLTTLMMTFYERIQVVQGFSIMSGKSIYYQYQYRGQYSYLNMNTQERGSKYGYSQPEPPKKANAVMIRQRMRQARLEYEARKREEEEEDDDTAATATAETLGVVEESLKKDNDEMMTNKEQQPIDETRENMMEEKYEYDDSEFQLQEVEQTRKIEQADLELELKANGARKIDEQELELQRKADTLVIEQHDVETRQSIPRPFDTEAAIELGLKSPFFFANVYRVKE